MAKVFPKRVKSAKIKLLNFLKVNSLNPINVMIEITYGLICKGYFYEYKGIKKYFALFE